MPRTLDNHLVGVTTNAPHPESYCPDLPLLLVENPHDRYDEGFTDGFDEGKEDGRTAGFESGYTQGKRDATARLRRQSEKPSA
jgi:hypothetical protein